MIFIYFACEFYRISNTIAYETLILNYNGKFNLGIYLFFFFNLHFHVMISQAYIYIYIYIYVCMYIIFKIFLFDHAVRPLTYWLNQ